MEQSPLSQTIKTLENLRHGPVRAQYPDRLTEVGLAFQALLPQGSSENVGNPRLFHIITTRSEAQSVDNVHATGTSYGRRWMDL